ncbi:MAG: 6-phosphofructokinase [Planctomycetes bacterium]|nr:6-phosphofructokinase [Planctomycetota bacterium]
MAGKKKIKCVGVLTGGGDCPGLNAVIRSVTKTLIHEHGVTVYGIYDGYAGLVEHRYERLDSADVSNILTRGGTILGSSNKANPFAYYPPQKVGGKHEKPRDASARAKALYRKLKLDALVCIGGDGTMAIADGLIRKCGMSIVGVPKTIDNDLPRTDYTFGFMTAVQTATEAIDRLHSTASSHHRVMVAEVMGRYAGWLALYAGAASGADVILIPEIPYEIEKVAEFVKDRSRRGKRFSIICVAEGAKPRGGKLTVERIVADSPEPVRLGGIGHKVAREIEELTGLESRATVLGYVQRGGTPCAFDRTLATEYGHHAAELVRAGRFGRLVVLHNGRISSVPINSIAGRIKKVPRNHRLVRAAEAVGTCFGG